jgi:hypothetical protein
VPLATGCLAAELSVSGLFVEPSDSPIETKVANLSLESKLCHTVTIMSANESAADKAKDAAALALPVSCQGFLVKHGGFLFKKVHGIPGVALFLCITHSDSFFRCKSDSSF